MAITDQQYLDWLAADGKRRCVLVELDYYDIDGASTGTLYAANLAYISTGSDTPADTAYDDIVTKIPGYSAKVSLPNPQGGSLGLRAQAAWGEIVISNESGARDSCRGYAFTGRAIRIYRGDPSWAKSDFRLVIEGRCAGVKAGRDDISFSLRGKEDALNVPIQTTEISGGPKDKALKPLLFGECYNAEPVITDAALHKYQYHDGSLNAFLATRDNGVAITPTTSTATGIITLTASPAGRITGDVQGDNAGSTYRTAAGELVSHIAQTYAGWASGDIDSSSVTALDSAAGQTLGIYVRDGGNVLEVINALLESCGAFWSITRAGKLRVQRLEAPSGTADYALVADDIRERSLVIDADFEPVQKVSVGYKRNWSAQDADSLAGAVSEADRVYYSQEYRYESAEDGSVATAWPLANSVTLDTLLQDSTEAAAEASRLLTLWSTPRTVYRCEATLALGKVELGDVVELTHPRFGLSGGEKFIVVGYDERLTSNSITLWLWG
jgi:hypothetical protein